MRATYALTVGLLLGGSLGWLGSSCATTSQAASDSSSIRSYTGACEQRALAPLELVDLVGAELAYAPGDSPRQTDVLFRREGERANLELVEEGHFDDSVRGESRFFELRHDDAAGWRVLSCARELRCYRGQSAGRCN